MSEFINISIMAPLLLGIVIGFIGFYFIRMYETYNAKSLGITISAFIGGGVLEFLIFLYSEVGDKSFHLWYVFGFSIGFIFNVLYQWILAFCFNKHRLDYRTRYQLFSSCNMSPEENEKYYLLVRKADKLNSCFKIWKKGKLEDDEMVNYIKKSNISKQEYDEMTNENSPLLLLDDDLITVFTAKGLQDYFTK